MLQRQNFPIGFRSLKIGPTAGMPEDISFTLHSDYWYHGKESFNWGKILMKLLRHIRTNTKNPAAADVTLTLLQIQK